MKTGIASDVAKSTKTIAKQAAKRAAQEPLEVLKTGRKQVAGVKETAARREDLVLDKKEQEISPQEKEAIKTRGKKRIEELEVEIKKIKEQKELKKREEEQVEEKEKQLEETEKPKDLPEVDSKHSRKIQIGMKGKLQKLKRRSEIRMPPSG